MKQDEERFSDARTPEGCQVPSLTAPNLGEDRQIPSAVAPSATTIELSDHHVLKILQGIGQAVHCFTLSGVITYWNKAAEELYGWSRSEAIGANIVTLACQEDTKGIGQQILALIGSGETWTGQFPLRRRNGELFVANVTDSPMYNDKGEVVGVIGVVSDSRPFNEAGNRVTSNVVSLDELRLSHRESPHPVSEGSIPSPEQPLATIVPLGSPVSSIKGTFRDKLSLSSEKRLGGEGESHAQSPLVAPRTKREEHDIASPSTSNRSLPFRQRSKDKIDLVGFTGNSAAASDSKPEGDHVLSVRSQEGRSEKSSEHTFLAGEQWEDAKVNAFELTDAEKDVWRRRSSEAGLYGKVVRWQTAQGTWDGPASEATTLSYDDSSSSHDGSEDLTPEHESGQHESEERASPTEISSLQRAGSTVSEEWTDWEIPWEELTIKEPIGQGAAGTVYHALWNGSDVAVKLYGETDSDKRLVEDFRKEIQVMRRLRHPNLLLFMGAVTTQGRLALVTEYLPRGDLWKMLHWKKPELDYRRRLRIALDVARGMTYLHKSRPPIIHRDLKSSNLLVASNWSVKIGDFGLSRVKDSEFLTAKSGRGTPQWMAPEMLRNERLDEKCDVYSFGVILWELVTLKMPWEDMHPMQVVGAVGFQHRRLPLPPDTDPRILAIMTQCWEESPAARPTFEEITASLQELQGQSMVHKS